VDVDDYFGRVNDGAYKNAVKQLLRSGKVIRQKEQWNAELDDREVLRRA
jgi:hypothetical protein